MNLEIKSDSIYKGARFGGSFQYFSNGDSLKNMIAYEDTAWMPEMVVVTHKKYTKKSLYSDRTFTEHCRHAQYAANCSMEPF